MFLYSSNRFLLLDGQSSASNAAFFHTLIINRFGRSVAAVRIRRDRVALLHLHCSPWCFMWNRPFCHLSYITDFIDLPIRALES
jgi:hypothetical protein